MTKLNEIMNWERMELQTENKVAINYMQKYVALLQEGNDDVTKLYAETLLRNIIDLDTKVEKTTQDQRVLLDYLKELDNIIGITSKVWYRSTPASNVQFIDDLSN